MGQLINYSFIFIYVLRSVERVCVHEAPSDFGFAASSELGVCTLEKELLACVCVCVCAYVYLL